MTPENIVLHQQSRELQLDWPDGVKHLISCEFLRVHSPSAEVRGHGPGQEVLQVGKEQVNITAIEPMGHYAIKLVFDDGHDSGLFNWPLLRKMGENQESMWADYLKLCAEAGHERQTPETKSSVEIYRP